VDVRNDLGLALGMQHGLGDAYLRRMQANTIRAKASSQPPIPFEQQLALTAWLPAAVRAQVVALERTGKFSPKFLPWSAEFPRLRAHLRLVGFRRFSKSAVFRVSDRRPSPFTGPQLRGPSVPRSIRAVQPRHAFLCRRQEDGAVRGATGDPSH
jgi:hypothetical protein